MSLLNYGFRLLEGILSRSYVPGYRKFAGAEEYVTGILSLPNVGLVH